MNWKIDVMPVGPLQMNAVLLTAEGHGQDPQDRVDSHDDHEDQEHVQPQVADRVGARAVHIPSVALVTRFCHTPYTSRIRKMTTE